MDDANRKRLEWLRDAKVGDMWPEKLFTTEQEAGWAPAVAAAAKAALEEIDRQSPEIQFDPARDVVTICGTPYSMGLFRTLPLGTKPGEAWVVKPSEGGIVVHSVSRPVESDWQPIETAPVEPWDKVASFYRFRCLLQIPNRHEPPTVTSGHGYYTTAPRSKERRLLRWSDGSHQVFPKFWMPHPAPKEV